MKLGVLITHQPNPHEPRSLPNLMRQIEELEFESIWVPHTVGRGLPTPDPLMTLAVASGATKKVKLGTAVLQVPLLEMTNLVQQLLSLSQVCGERLRIGIGAGSTESDFQAHGKNFESRFSVFWKSVKFLKDGLRTGKLDDVDLSALVSDGGSKVPLYLGSWGNTVERAAREFSGWIASAAYRSDEEVCAALGRYRDSDGQNAIVSTILGVPDTAALAERLARFNDAGFDEAVVALMPNSPSLETIR